MSQRDIGREIVIQRAKRGWTQKELAERLRTTQRTVAAWETGDSKPRQAMRAKIAIAMGLPEEYFFDNYDVKERVEGNVDTNTQYDLNYQQTANQHAAYQQKAYRQEEGMIPGQSVQPDTSGASGLNYMSYNTTDIPSYQQYQQYQNYQQYQQFLQYQQRHQDTANVNNINKMQTVEGYSGQDYASQGFVQSYVAQGQPYFQQGIRYIPFGQNVYTQAPADYSYRTPIVPNDSAVHPAVPVADSFQGVKAAAELGEGNSGDIAYNEEERKLRLKKLFSRIEALLAESGAAGLVSEEQKSLCMDSMHKILGI